MNQRIYFLLIPLFFLPSQLLAQIDEDQYGAWYMYFWNVNLPERSWGVQGDFQYRNWNLIGDLEQLLLRGGLTYVPQGTGVKFTLGYAYIRTGEFGDSRDFVEESRIYQEALLPQQIGKRFWLTHRFRYEQRWVESQHFRTRYRYNLFLNVPFNRPDLKKGAWYLALYNELFINGQREIGNGRRVEIFDRNRFYTALGYSLRDHLRVQLGFMQQRTDNWVKGQIQLSLHHTL